jgi:type VI secretion system protein
MTPGRRPCRASVFAVAFVTAALLSACSVTKKVRSAFGGDLPMQVTVAQQANENSPVAVDVVVVYDRKLVDELLKMPASQWFAPKVKQQFLADHARKVEVRGWEWVPGQKVDRIPLEYRAGAQQVIIFADYHTDGAHRLVVPPQQPFHLLLAEREIKLEPPEKAP